MPASGSWTIPVALTPGTTYYWRVQAYNGTSWSAWSSPASFAAASPAALGRPSWGRFETWELGAGDELAVNVATRNLVASHPIVSLPIRGSSVELALAYNSQDPTNIGMGPGWRLNIDRRLESPTWGSNILYAGPDGARHTFTWTGSAYQRPATLYAELTQNGAGFKVTYRDGSYDLFAASGLLDAGRDRQPMTPAWARDTYGHALEAQPGESQGRPHTTVDSWSIGIPACPQLASATGPLSRFPQATPGGGSVSSSFIADTTPSTG